MKKLTGLVTLLCLSALAFANDIRFVNNLSWKQIKEKAAREKKMIFFDAYTTWCGPCRYLEQKVYTNSEVAAYFNANYINVKFDMEAGEGEQLAEEFGISSYPTLLFFNADGKLVHKRIGAMEASEFLVLGKEAGDPSTQYFLVKEKARQLKLTDAAFNQWAGQAEKLDDDEKDKIISAYLQSKTDILGNKDIASTVMMYAEKLNDRQLAYLHAKKDRIAELMGWDAARTASVLYKKLFRLASKIYQATDNMDTFRTMIRKFDPKREGYAVKDLNFRMMLFVYKDMNKATELLAGYLSDTKEPVDVEDIATWLIDYSDNFETAHFVTLNKALSTFRLRAIDKDKEYWLYLMQMLCYAKTNNSEMARSFAEKAYRHTLLPGAYKEVLKDSYGFTD